METDLASAQSSLREIQDAVNEDDKVFSSSPRLNL